MRKLRQMKMQEVKNFVFTVVWKYANYGDEGITQIAKDLTSLDWEEAYYHAITAWYDHGGTQNRGTTETGWVVNDLFEALTYIARKGKYEKEEITKECFWICQPRRGIARLLFGR